jgi:hypothetical protein
MVLHYFRSSVLALALSMVLLASSCFSGGPMARFDDAVALAPSFIAAVQTSGGISAELAADLRRDVTDLGELKTNVTTCHQAVSVDDTAKDFKKAQCYVAAGKEGQAILARHFKSASNPRVQVIAQLINDCLQIIINHYGTPETARSAGADDQFERDLDSKVKQLKRELENK